MNLFKRYNTKKNYIETGYKAYWDILYIIHKYYKRGTVLQSYTSSNRAASSGISASPSNSSMPLKLVKAYSSV